MSQKYFLMNVSTKGLKDSWEFASVCKGTSPKKKADLIEMIVYECMTETLNKKDLADISNKESKEILNKNNVIIDSLPEYANMALKKKEIKPCVKKKIFIDVSKWNITTKDNYFIESFTHR